MMNFATVRMNVGKDKVDVQNWSIKMDLAMSLYRRPYAAGPAQCFFCQKLLSKRPTSRITAFCCCPVRVHHQCWLEKIRKVAGVLMGGMQEDPDLDCPGCKTRIRKFFSLAPDSLSCETKVLLPRERESRIEVLRDYGCSSA
jgi:hypothetical protein